MDNYERTIDLVHVFNYVKYNLMKIIIITVVFALLGVGLVTAKNIISPSEKLYYSTAKILFKFDSWSTSEKDYSIEDWNLNGTEKELFDSNGAFFNNSKYVFTADKIIMNLMDEYGYGKKLSEFKENIIVENLPASDIVRIIVTASSPQKAEDMLNAIISEGVKSVENLYMLKYEIFDKYTYGDVPFVKLSVNSEGDIIVLSSFGFDCLIVGVVSVLGFVVGLIYFILKVLLNKNVDSVDYIEKGFRVPVMQLVGTKNDNYDYVSTKIINNNYKTIQFTGLTKFDSIDEDVVGIAQRLLLRNKKVLLVYVECKSEVNENLKENVESYKGINAVYSSINDFENNINKCINDYDFVLVETRSIKEKSDSLLLSNKVESTILVNNCNTVSIEEFKRVVFDYKNYGRGITGIVLKNIKEDSESYKYLKSSK